jgi:hypothetical protein
VAGGDVEEAELVGAGRVIGDGLLDRVAGIDEVDEVDALDDAPSLTSRQGMMRALSIPGAAIQNPGILEGFCLRGRGRRL